MTRKTKTKKKPEAKPAGKTDSKPPVVPTQASDREENDYGGLPERDLKKNLGGCG